MNDGSVVLGGLEAALIWPPEHKLETLAQSRPDSYPSLE